MQLGDPAKRVKVPPPPPWTHILVMMSHTSSTPHSDIVCGIIQATAICALLSRTEVAAAVGQLSLPCTSLDFIRLPVADVAFVDLELRGVACMRTAG